jgi:hypothetical protein
MSVHYKYSWYIITKEFKMTVNDLSILLAAIDIAIKRGTYSILEVGAIGDMAARLNEFLKNANEQAKAASEAPAEGEATPEAPAA